MLLPGSLVMKAAQLKSTTATAPPQTKKQGQAFFQKGGGDSAVADERVPFFSGKSAIQTKLTVGQPGDKYEQEADQVADRVVQRLSEPDAPAVQKKSATVTPISTIQRRTGVSKEERDHEQELVGESDELLQRKPIFESGGDDEPDVQRMSSDCTEKEGFLQAKSDVTPQASQGFESQLNSSKGGGSPLPENTRSGMEQAFGADFSGVRVHTGSDAVQMNKDLGARAFTHGSDIYFNSGGYDTGSRGGQHLLAHELTHTVQQGGVNRDSSAPVQKAKSKETDSISSFIQQVKKQKIQRVPSPTYAHTFRPGLSPIGSIYKNTYDGSASTTIKDGWETWSFERRWQLYDADNQLLDESYYTIPQPTYMIDKKFVRIGAAGGTDKPWSVWLKVTETLVPFGGDDKENFPHSYITFPVFNTPLDDSKGNESKITDEDNGFGIAVPKGKAPSSPANAKVVPEVALKILENVSKGEPPFIPDKGKAGCSWFVTEGNPYIGASKGIDIVVEISKNAEKVVFDTVKLEQLFTDILSKTESEAETEWRSRNNKTGKSLTPAQERQLGKFKERFAEARMWDRVGEIVRNSKDGVGEVILEQGRFSKQGAGKFAVVANPKMIQVKGGVQSLLATLNKAGISAEPVVVEAAEALAKKQKWTGWVRGAFRVGGRIMLVVAITTDVYKIYYAQDKLKATIVAAGGWTGAIATGTAFAAWFTPADTAGPLAWAAHGVGTLVAGGVGYWVGSETTRYIYELVLAE